MKRCPQCEFIYEDDQSLCDMDGILLVFDSQQLPKLTPSSAVLTKSQGRNRMIPVVAALVLATVLFLVYNVSTRQPPASRSTYVPAAAGNTQPPSSSEPSANSKVINTANEAGTTEKSPVTPMPPPEVKENNASKTNATTVTTPTGAAKESKQKPRAKSAQKAQTQPQQDDSKIGSLIKKTGRLL